MIKLSDRALELQFSPIRKLMPEATKAKERGIKIYHLNIGQPDIESPKIFLQKVKEFDEKVVVYEKSEGNSLLRSSLAEYYQRLDLNIKSEDIVVTTGGSEGLWMIFFILFNSGDECLTFDPTYTNYLTFSKLNGVNLRAVPTTLADNFNLPSMEIIKQAVTKKTKAILITNPSNPTGAVYSKKLLDELVEFCVRNNLYIISDETYREFVYSGPKAVSLLSYKQAEKLTVVVDSLSKRYSLCGARLGMLVSKNKEILEAANKIAQARLASGTIEQYAASFLLEVEPNYFETIKREYQHRRDVLIKGLEKIKGVKVSHPDGAFYLIAELPVKSAEDFCLFLLKEFEDKKETVMLAPAEGFYITPGLGKSQVRIAYVIESKALERACELISKGLTAYHNRA